jgi:hypothetical protein
MSAWLDEPRCWQSRWSVYATEATGAARSVAAASQRRGVEHYLASRRAYRARSWRSASVPAPPGRQSGMTRRLRIRHMMRQPPRSTDRRKGGQVATGEIKDHTDLGMGRRCYATDQAVVDRRTLSPLFEIAHDSTLSNLPNNTMPGGLRIAADPRVWSCPSPKPRPTRAGAPRGDNPPTGPRPDPGWK